jgi:ABC-type transport system involved in multi-copper enzyme maturation permease subunit
MGPVFARELVTAPRRMRWYVSRGVYVATLLVLVATAWLLLAGTQQVRNVGDTARFGAAVFQILAPLQLALAVFCGALFTASAVAQEKDRRTFDLLLMTSLSDVELVLGKLLASLLNVLALLAAAVPVFMILALFGGIGHAQIARVFGVTLLSVLVAGSLGSTIALWREKTVQTLWLTALAIVFWLAVGELLAAGLFGTAWQGVPASTWAAGFSPRHALVAAASPQAAMTAALPGFGSPVNLFLACAAAGVVGLNGLTVLRVRVWNPSREVQRRQEQPEATFASLDAPAARSPHAAPGKSRPVWDNPVLWREVCTWAYGRKILLVRLAYLALFAVAALAVHHLVSQGAATRGSIAAVLVPLMVLSLVLVNALAVTSITTERDGGALDLLLVTDLTSSEFIFGKLGGVFYVAKEMVILPPALCGYLWWAGQLSLENLAYIKGGLVVMYLFAAVLGLHAGLTYLNSRSAVAVSLGTVFFLFVGIATCMRIMIAFSGSFQLQLAPFLAFMVGGGTGLFFALGVRNPSQAIGWASFALPVFTFVAITSFLQGYNLQVFLVAAATYGFTTAAMLIPAIYEFDVATGRTTPGE